MGIILHGSPKRGTLTRKEKETMQRQTTLAKKEEITRKWILIDATDIPLGRLASKVAVILMGKDKPTYTPNQDCGDNVVIINASKVKLTGNHPRTKKNYYNVSGYNGGLRTRTSGVMLEEFPVELVERAVWGMLPKGRLGRTISKKLYVYKDEKHEQEAQKPEMLALKK